MLVTFSSVVERHGAAQVSLTTPARLWHTKCESDLMQQVLQFHPTHATIQM